jgi:hypothetical protein
MKKIILLIFGISFLFLSVLKAQLSGYEQRRISISSLQSHFSAYGSERAWNNVYYEGLRWPADIPEQDNSVIKRAWLAARNFTDESGNYHDFSSIYFHLNNVGNNQFPVELTQSAKYPKPSVHINGQETSYLDQDYIDTYDPTQAPDRIITNIVNTSLGLTQTRKILAFSQKNHENYFIKIFTYTNTGNTDFEPDIELTDSLHGVHVGWGTRYSGGRQGAQATGNTWGQHDWVTRRGEDYSEHYLDPITPENPIAEWLRSGFSWMGQSSQLSYDNIGAPDVTGNGRLLSPHFVGSVVLHVDVSASDPTDDVSQPTFLGWHAGDTYPDQDDHAATYSMLAGNPYPNTSFGGTDRLDSHLESITHRLDPYTIHGDGGGTNIMTTYGPFDLAHGESITIVEAEGINGLSQEMCQLIGERWKSAYVNPGDTGPFILPDHSETNDKDLYKNSWVYTGMDSIMLTFTRAKQNFDANYQITQPPPPMVFDLNASNDQISLAWNNSAESSPEFGGYKIYRKQLLSSGEFQEVFTCGVGTDHPQIENTYIDLDVLDSTDYQYYLVSFSLNNNLESGKFYTLTTLPIRLLDTPRVDADLFVSPNGSDENSGLNASEPLKTISLALERILHSKLHPHTIHLAEGIYSPSNNGEELPLNIGGFLEITGEVGTILDAENTSRVLSVTGENIKLNNLWIRNGLANNVLTQGGGIFAQDAILALDNVKISDCSAISGGGLWANMSQLSFSGVTVSKNHAEQIGGGIYLGVIDSLNFDEQNTNSIYHNTAGEVGFDLYSFSWPSFTSYQLSLDTFTVSSPSDYHTFPASTFELNINTGLENQYAADLFVSPVGDDSNTGLTSAEPLQTISKALQTIVTDPDQPQTIYLEAGIYSPGNSGEKYPLYPRDYLTIIGVSPTATILNAEQKSGLVVAYAHEAVAIQELGLKNGTRETAGTAISVSHSIIDFASLIIEDNVGPGGAAALAINAESHSNLSNVTIRHNSGGGLYLAGTAQVSFDPVNRCSIYLNETDDRIGQDIRSYLNYSPINVTLDTCTQKYPTLEIAAPLEAFTFDILNGIIPQAAHDLYVSADGSDDNSGLSPDEPLQSISLALDLIFANDEHPRSIFLANGIYSPALTNETFPLEGKDHVSIIGESVESTILDGDSLSSIFNFNTIQHMNIKQLTIRNGLDIHGGAMTLTKSSPLFQRVLFIDNHCEKTGGVIYLDASEWPYNETRPIFVNCSFINNTTDLGAAGVLMFYSQSYPVFINSLFWNNGIYPIISNAPGVTTLANCLIEGGEGAALPSVQWLGEILDSDPLFVNGDPISYELMPGSPAIDAGVTQFVLEGDTLINIARDKFMGNAPDIGAFESPYTVGVDPHEQRPFTHMLHQNYPNPFNPSTNIRYGLMETTKASLVVYDITGRVVLQFEEKELAAGWYNLSWAGVDQWGQPVSTGVYFCRLQAGEFSKTIKMILLK